MRAGCSSSGSRTTLISGASSTPFALVATLLAETRHISFFTDVANLPLRPPAVMAKAAASLDVLSGGRFELGLGAGGFHDHIAGMGGPRRSPGDSVEALEKAIDVIRLMWSGERSVSFEGRHYRLAGARPGPRPVHQMGIWLGAFKPRMLRLVGPAAEAAGRDPRQIRRILTCRA